MSFKKQYIVSAAEGAIAAPILEVSLTPKSTILPGHTRVIFTFPPKPTTAQPAAVAVHCAVGVRCPPYSNGNLNCLSAVQK